MFLSEIIISRYIGTCISLNCLALVPLSLNNNKPVKTSKFKAFKFFLNGMYPSCFNQNTQIKFEFWLLFVLRFP